MNIVHINLADHHGGAAMAAFRLHQALRRAGHDSRMLVWRKYTDDPNVDIFEKHTVLRALSLTVGKQLDGLGYQYRFHPASMRLPQHPWVQQADIIHLHLLHSGYFALRVLPALSQVAPIVWTMHDMWAATGHCAVAAYSECDRWRSGCGNCPQLHDYPAIRRDRTSQLWREKDRIYAQADVTVVCPSDWMTGHLAQSPLLNRFPIHHIANGIDLTIFRPIDKVIARESLSMDLQERVLMFGAASLSQSRKGADLLLSALKALPDHLLESLTILLVGRGAAPLMSSLPGLHWRPLGAVQNERLMAICYAAADLYVLPSIAENLPNSLMESLGCGTPCVAFDVGGCPEIVEHGQTGYLASVGDVADLASGIRLLLCEDGLRQEMGQASVRKAREAFDVNVQAGRYLLQYERCLNPR